MNRIVPMTDSYSARINQAMPDLTPTELKVARRLIASGGAVALQSSTRLAEHVGVSGPTISRLVKKLGFHDYAAFQTFVRTDVDDRMRSPIETFEHGVEESAGSDDDITSFERARIRALSATMADLPRHELNEASRLLAAVRSTVGVMGGWTTTILARHLVAQLQQIRPRVHHIGDSPSDLASFTTDANSHSTAALFDFRRYEQPTIDLARTLRQRKCRVILITDAWLSPAVEDADVVLPVVVDSGDGPFDTLTPAMAVLEMLVELTVGEVGPSALERYRRYNQRSIEQVARWAAGDS